MGGLISGAFECKKGKKLEILILPAYNRTMLQKIIAGSAVFIFIFVLITTAWDYCRPDPDTLLFKENSVSHGQQIKKPHHPCASLKDAYDVFAASKISHRNIQQDFRDMTSDFPEGSFAGNSSDFHGLSPPSENSPPHDLPIFLLYRNLRL